MNFSEYQSKAKTTAIYPDKGNNFIYPANISNFHYRSGNQRTVRKTRLRWNCHFVRNTGFREYRYDYGAYAYNGFDLAIFLIRRLIADELFPCSCACGEYSNASRDALD